MIKFCRRNQMKIRLQDKKNGKNFHLVHEYFNWIAAYQIVNVCWFH